MATGGLIAQKFGAKQMQEASRISARALVLALILSGFLILFQIPLLKIALWAMEDDGKWQHLTAEYFQVRIFAAPATLCTYALLGTLIGLQRVNAVFGLQVLLNVLNVALTIILFQWTDLGIKGVALATVISEYVTLIVGCIILKTYIFSAINQNRFLAWLFETAALKRFFSISSDLFIRTLCLTFAFYWMTVLSAKQGVVVLAAHWLFNWQERYKTPQAFRIRERDTSDNFSHRIQSVFLDFR